MSEIQIGILIVLGALLLFVAIFFWGSLASAFSILALLLIPGVLAYRWIWIDREDRAFDESDPMNIVYNRHFDSIGGKEDYE